MKLFKFFILPILGIFLVATSIMAQQFPQPVSHVNDFGKLLSPSFVQELETDLENFENETTAEITVVTLGTLGDNNLEDYAVRLFEQWGIGKKEKDNGLLLLIVEKERQIRIEVGYGLEPVVTDSRAGRVIREKISPNFKKGDYDQGVRLAVGQLQEYIRSGEPPAAAETVRETAKFHFPLVIFSMILLIYLASFWSRSKRVWPGGVVGGLLGGVLGLIVGTLVSFLLLTIGLGLLGLFLDWLLSQNYKKLKQAKKPTSFRKSWGGFSGGGGGGGGFGGFGGGSSGGGGASGGW